MLQTTKEVFIKNLRRLMYDNRVTQKDLSDGINISQATISDWLNGKIYPRPHSMDKIAAFFKVPQTVLTGTPSIIVQELQLNSEEVLLVKKFRCLNDSQKSLVRNMLGMFVEQ